jgi:hypothetical protein
MVFESAGVADDATKGEEGLHEADDVVRAVALPLAVGENRVETPPFGGLQSVGGKAQPRCDSIVALACGSSTRARR